MLGRRNTALLNIFEFDFRYDWVATVLRSLESTFTSIAEKGRNEPWFDGLFQMEHAEAVYGVAYVAAQAYILGTTQDANRIREAAGKNHVSKIDYYADARQCDGTNTSAISLINSIANYYKHNDEWGDTWPCNHTTNTLAAVGIDSSVEFPCHKAAVVLFGEDDAWKLDLILQEISEWRQEIIARYR